MKRPLAVLGLLVAIILAACPIDEGAARDQSATPALAGQVSSSAEGVMEGVLVSARKQGSSITVTVVTDADGRYRFPAAKLSAGEYGLSIRAVGYELDGPQSAEVGEKTAIVDLKLHAAMTKLLNTLIDR